MKVQANGISFNVNITGDKNAPAVMLSHSLATTMEMWKPQLGPLSEKFRVVNYDMRGHGETDATEGAYSIESLAGDAVALMDALKLEKVHFVGLSIGGMIGQALAINHADRLHRLVICSSTSSLRHADPAMWDERIRSVQNGGMEVQVEGTIGRWFTDPFIAAHDDVVEPVRQMIRNTSVAGFVGCCHAIKPLHLTDQLGRIVLPVLVMPGEKDPGTPPPLSQAIHDAIPGSILKIIEDASHLSNLQQPETFNKNLMAFLSS